MPALRPTYTATFQRAENGTWVVRVVEEPNVHGFGDTLADARRNVRDAITTLFGPFKTGPDGFELVEDIQLPEAVLASVSEARRLRAQARRQRSEVRAAEEAAEATMRQALEVTRHAARLLSEHAGFMKAQADDAGLVDDVRLPDAVLLTVERSHVERQLARQQSEAVGAALKAAASASSAAVAANREAARLLTDRCGLPMGEAAQLLGLSPQRAQQLLGS